MGGGGGGVGGFFFNDTATTEIYTLSLHDALPISMWKHRPAVSVICTSKSRTSLHAKLTPTHGNHVFHTTKEIPSLNQVCHHYYVG